MIFLDANFFLRTLTRPVLPNDLRMNQIASELFRRVEIGEVEVTTSDAVIAEVAFILTAKAHYHLAVDEAVGRLSALLRLRGFKLRDKRTVLDAFDLWVANPRLGFVDALTASHARNTDVQLATFDTDFDGLPGITRWSPEPEGSNGHAG